MRLIGTIGIGTQPSLCKNITLFYPKHNVVLTKTSAGINRNNTVFLKLEHNDNVQGLPGLKTKTATSIGSLFFQLKLY